MERRRTSRGRDQGKRDRRGASRARLGSIFVNKYIDGHPYLGTLLDLSPDGMMVQKLLEPNVARAFYAIELGVPWQPEEDSLWIWTQCVRDLGDRQALCFVGLKPRERERVEQLVVEARRVA